MRTIAPRGPTTTAFSGCTETHWTARSIYERYASAGEPRRRHPEALVWFEPYPAMFLERVLEDPTELNVAALMGVLSAAVRSPDGPGAAKDFRLAALPPGFSAAQQFYEELRPPKAHGAGKKDGQ
jgi:hypothetical protein